MGTSVVLIPCGFISIVFLLKGLKCADNVKRRSFECRAIGKQIVPVVFFAEIGSKLQN